MVAVGHLLQVCHILLVWIVGYWMGRKPLVGLIWALLVFGSGAICGGYCPITLLSNYFFRGGGSNVYDDTTCWLSAISGMPKIISFFLIMLPMFAMMYIGASNRRKSLSASNPSR